jgi:hypothetical protein
LLTTACGTALTTARAAVLTTARVAAAGAEILTVAGAAADGGAAVEPLGKWLLFTPVHICAHAPLFTLVQSCAHASLCTWLLLDARWLLGRCPRRRVHQRARTTRTRRVREGSSTAHPA